MVGVGQAAFSGEERAIDSPMSVVGVGRVAGEVSAGKLDLMIGEHGGQVLVPRRAAGLAQPHALRLQPHPAPALDGGHIAGRCGRACAHRRRGAAEPAHVDVAKGLPIAYAVSLVLIAMSVLLIYADVVNPIKLGG